MCYAAGCAARVWVPGASLMSCIFPFAPAGMPEIDYTTMIHTPKDPIFNVELRSKSVDN